MANVRWGRHGAIAEDSSRAIWLRSGVIQDTSLGGGGAEVLTVENVELSLSVQNITLSNASVPLVVSDVEFSWDIEDVDLQAGIFAPAVTLQLNVEAVTLTSRNAQAENVTLSLNVESITLVGDTPNAQASNVTLPMTVESILLTTDTPVILPEDVTLSMNVQSVTLTVGSTVKPVYNIVAPIKGNVVCPIVEITLG